VRQFLGESMLLTLGAFVLSLLVARAALPVFNPLTDKELSLFAGHAGFVALLLGAARVVAMGATS
jgi:heme A synthase